MLEKTRYSKDISISMGGRDGGREGGFSLQPFPSAHEPLKHHVSSVAQEESSLPREDVPGCTGHSTRALCS